MKQTLPLLLVIIVFSITSYGQDRVYWSDQNDPDKVKSVNASDLGSALTPVLISVPSGIAYYHANPTYPLKSSVQRCRISGRNVFDGHYHEGTEVD